MCKKNNNICELLLRYAQQCQNSFEYLPERELSS